MAVQAAQAVRGSEPLLSSAAQEGEIVVVGRTVPVTSPPPSRWGCIKISKYVIGFLVGLGGVLVGVSTAIASPNLAGKVVGGIGAGCLIFTGGFVAWLEKRDRAAAAAAAAVAAAALPVDSAPDTAGARATHSARAPDHTHSADGDAGGGVGAAVSSALRRRGSRLEPDSHGSPNGSARVVDRAGSVSGDAGGGAGAVARGQQPLASMLIDDDIEMVLVPGTPPVEMDLFPE